MFLNNSHLFGRSGISRIMFTTVIVLIFVSGMVVAQDGESILRVGMNSPVNLDPATGSNDPEVLFNRTVYDYLIETRPDSSLEPNLASEWTISEDGLTYTFSLVEGVTFHDGSSFTSADVVFTFNRLKDLESPAMSLLGDFEVTALDDFTVEFALPERNADFLYGVGSRFALILKDGTENPSDVANVNGTGPFVLSDYSAGERAVFTANENYWMEGEPQLDQVIFLFIEDSQTQVEALRAGQVDFLFKMSPDQVFNLEGEDGIEILTIPTNQHPVIRIRSDEGSLGEDPRIREAFKLATDRAELLATVQEGFGVLGNNDPIGPLYSDFYAEDVDTAGFDPETACQLIQEATGEERLSSEFYVVDAFDGTYERLGTALQSQWEQGCIDVEILLRPEGVYYANDEWLTVDLGITGWGDRPVPQSLLTEAYVTGGIYNETHFSDPEMDALVDEAGVTADTEARAELYQQIAGVFADRGPIIIPWFSSMIGAVRTNVEGLEMHPFPGQTDFRGVTVE